MRICELRRFLGDFVVFINLKKDIDKLKKDSRFKFHSRYKEKKGRCYGYEFRFNYNNKTLKEAKRFVEEILHANSSS